MNVLESDKMICSLSLIAVTILKLCIHFVIIECNCVGVS